MKWSTNIILFVVLLLSVNLQANELTGYQLGPDDKISINIFNEPDLSAKSLKISINGAVSLPLIGQVSVLGLTTSQVESKIAALYLNGYLKDPQVSVSVIEYRQFYINGEVKSPGGYHYREGLTVQKAISLAGGFTPRAARNDITLIRENNNHEKKAKLSDLVKPGDLITIDESFF
ncbi:polysaccharide biosynthesis/export family protein [Catenovulum adriaticum]|uniref:Polysaccharide export protein n=1 Tax=Catenovulum adriaticum TaxID=2984846 RepID=A0ABY7ARK9_9ALTE|nr:polysaccharide biosynthesis/export family protein [Catenovulum sp. TS8]WAJ70984.1 polysaccharide export protein [Catenovulum sp. TS8]